MSISFGGIATGLDTDSIVNQLLSLERRPIERLEGEKNYLNSRLKAFQDFDSKLKDLLTKFEGLDTANEVSSYEATPGSEEFFSVSASSTALPGNYQIEVESLAKLQKDVSQGYASKTDASFGTGTLTLNVGGTDTVVNYDGDSLSSLAEKINAADTGVTASIINDGATGYRMVLSGDDSATIFSATVNETVAGAYAPPAYATTQSAAQASIVVDGITIKSNSNTFSEAIPGITIDILKANADAVPPETTSLSVSSDNDAVKEKVKGIVDAYNGVMSFIDDQSDASWSTDPAFRTTKRQLQSFLTTSIAGTGAYKTLTSLGLETQKDGTVTLDSTQLDEALETDFDSVVNLLAGEDGVEGISDKFAGYLDQITDSVDGLSASRKDSTESNIKRMDTSIERYEMRLEQREKTLRAQFEALEVLMSGMNSQSSFLAQQMTMLNNLGSQR